MSNKSNENQSLAEEADPVPTTIETESLTNKSDESASSIAERVSAPMQPGDTKTPARRLSDVPGGMRAGAWESEEDEQRGKGMLQAAQESVARALDGGSRGAS
ncbi:hypothetical protein AWENTII_000127 [Aspergillus wentii]